MLSCSRWSSKDADDQLNLKNTAKDSLNDALQTVGASYDISTRKDIWTPEKLPPQVAFFTKIKQTKALKVAGKKQKAAKFCFRNHHRTRKRAKKSAPQQIIGTILVPDQSQEVEVAVLPP